MSINIDALTFGQFKELAGLFKNQPETLPLIPHTLNQQVGEKVIIRTYSAGVWFGLLSQKSGNEVILTNARRLWRWQCVRSLSLSGVVTYGINPNKSRIAPAVSQVWLEAIEILSCTDTAISSIEGADNAEAE